MTTLQYLLFYTLPIGVPLLLIAIGIGMIASRTGDIRHELRRINRPRRRQGDQVASFVLPAAASLATLEDDDTAVRPPPPPLSLVDADTVIGAQR